ncbi:hypothetical protein CAEBREN_04073 [Caenorhabditis brenneri]|uniref:Uncharacterized protein n=1 Tax=Caenorhabditis brenneri TaxID=135651 RepID=G0MGX1_CAEBE|nr:hypothetical protein CAEBREN_04073 [Caenorhabditis brenneri]
MSTRPTTNLERLMASVNFKEDEVVLTPEPLMAKGLKPYFNFNQIPAPTTGETTDSGEESKKEDEDEFFTASQGSSYSSSLEDVPLTPELLTSGVQVETLAGTRNMWNGRHEPRQKRLVKRSSSVRQPVKKIMHTSSLPTPSDSVFKYDSNSDGLDDYQGESERNKKRKMKKRSNGNEKRQENGKEKKN